MKKIFILFLLVLAILLIFSHTVYGKDYYFPSVKINININKDGSFDIIEQRTYAFSGEFHWATYNLKKWDLKK